MYFFLLKYSRMGAKAYILETMVKVYLSSGWPVYSAPHLPDHCSPNTNYKGLFLAVTHSYFRFLWQTTFVSNLS